MDYLPNAEGVRWFLELVLPRIEDRLSGCRITIVGKNPPRDLLKFARKGHVRFTGRVDDVRPFTRSADVFVVPLQIGGGTRLKILEALAMAIPVVSTRIGAEGLDLEDGIHLRLADTPVEMAEAIVDLCRRDVEAARMAQEGYERVCSMYDWDSVTDRLYACYSEKND